MSNRLIVVLFAVSTVAFFSFGSYKNWPYKIESDGKYYYHFLVSFWNDCDLDFTNDYRTEQPAWAHSSLDNYEFKNRVSPITGRPATVFTCGLAILWLPFFTFAQFLLFIGSWVGFSVPEGGAWSLFHQYTVMYSAVLFTCWGLYLLARIGMRWIGVNSGQAILMVLFSSPLFYYAIFEPSLSHAYDFFSLCLILWVMAEYRSDRHWQRYVYVGAALALHFLIRTQNLITILIFMGVLVKYWEIRVRSDWRGIGVMLGVLFLGVLPTFIINKYIFGAYSVVPQTAAFGERFLDLTRPHFFSVLFSLRNGLFSHHPFLLLGLWGYTMRLLNSWRSDQSEKWVYAGLGAAFLAQVYINSSVLDWWAGHSFGQRRLVSMLPLFALGFLEVERWVGLMAKKYQAGWAATGGLAVVSGIYLMFIHVFLWDYDQPHNILEWMFVLAPQKWF